MQSKYPICQERVRRIPKQFSWVDHRLVRDRHIESLNHPAASLYLFLVTVGDHQGLSYYGDESIGKRLSMNAQILQTARDNLIQAGLIAWQRPIYQVLDMDVPKMTEMRVINIPSPGIRVKNAKPESLREILKQMLGGALP